MAVVSLDDVKRIIKAIRTDILDKLSLTDTKATHTNREVLDKFTEEADTGKLLYNGEKVISPVSEEVTNKIQVTEDAVDESTGDVTTKGGLLVEGLSDTDKTTLITDLTVDKNLVVSPTNMTGNSAPAPYVVTVTSESSTLTSGYCAFDGKDSTSWTTSAYKGDTATLVIDLGVETTMDTLIMASNYANYTPASFIFYGSNDKSTYDTLLTVDDAGTWVVGEDKIFPLDNSATYRYYKLYVTATTKSNNYFDLRKIEFTYKGKTNSLESTNDNKVISYNDMYDVLTSVGTGSGTGSSTVEDSAINGNIINNGEELVVYDDTEMQSAIADLNNRGVVGEKGEYGYFKLSADYSSTIAEGTVVPFDTVVQANKVALGTSAGSVVLHSGITYKLTLQMYSGGKSCNPYVQFYNVTTGEFIGHQLYLPTVDYSSKANGGDILTMLYTPDSDCEVNAKFIKSTTYPSTVYSLLTALIVEEVSRTYLVDPTKQAQDYEVETVLFTSDALATSGDITLSEDYSKFDYLFIELGDASSSTTNQIKVDKLLATTSTDYINLHGYSALYVNIYHSTNTSITISGTSSNTFGIKRIIGVKSKNPVIVEYSPSQATFSKTTLFEGNASSIANYVLSDSVKNYDLIYMFAKSYDSSKAQMSQVYDTEDINTTDDQNAYIFQWSSTMWIGINFTTGFDSFNVNNFANASGSNVGITKVVGIKGGQTVSYANLTMQQKSDLKEQLGLNEVDATVTTNAITEKVNSLWEVTN